MIWIVIIVLAIAALFVVLRLLNPVLVVLSKTPTPRVEATLTVQPGKVICELTLRQTKKNHFITSFSGDRITLQKIGLQPPEQFIVTPYDESGSAAELGKKLNAEELRFTGHLLLEPEKTIQVIFPSASTTVSEFEIMGMFESGQTFMNMTSGFLMKYKPEANKTTTDNLRGVAPTVSEP